MNENEINTDVVENTTPVQPEIDTPPVEPVQPAPEAPVVPEAPVEETPVEPSEPVMPTEPVVAPAPEASATPSEPVMPTEPVAAPEAPATPEAPVAPIEPIKMEDKPKKGGAFRWILIILFILIIAGCLVYYFFLKDKINKPSTTTTTTVAVLKEDEAKEKVTEVLGKYYYNSLYEFDTWCGGTALDMESSITLDESKNAYKVKDFANLEAIKKDMNTIMTDTMIETASKKFTEQEGVLYCYVPASSFAYVNQDSVEVKSVEVTADQITAKASYTTGGDELFELETKEIEVVTKKVGNSWLIDSIK